MTKSEPRKGSKDRPSIAVGDLVAFDGDQGPESGCIAALKRDIGNGEMYAWVELDRQWSGMFCMVALGDIALSSCRNSCGKINQNI